MAAEINAVRVDRRDGRAGVYTNTHGLELAPCALDDASRMPASSRGPASMR